MSESSASSLNAKVGTGSLTDYEISIVKNLLATKEYNNQEILGLVNAVRRVNGIPDTNGGRISELRSFHNMRLESLKPAQINKFKAVAAASDTDRKAFLELANNSQGAPVVSNLSPLDDRIIKDLLPLKTENPLVLNITETDCIECKETFSYVIKTIAAFANNKGGYFVFGVKDKTWEVVGLDKKLDVFNNYDLKTINTEIRNKLGADLQIQKRLIEIKGKKVGLLYIAPAHIKPLIFVSGDGDITQGHIYYRYSGEDRLISPQDLQKLLEDRLRQLTETVLMKHLSGIFKNGIENSAVMNVGSGEVVGKADSFVIDESLLPKIQFIKEGEFVEKSGAPALKLMGNLKTVSTVLVKTSVTALTDERVIKDFINQTKVESPVAYIEFLKATQAKWLPIYYYMHLAGLSVDKAIAILKSGGGKPIQIKEQVSRLSNSRNPKASGKPTGFSSEIAFIRARKVLVPGDKKYLRMLQAILHLQKNEIDKEYAFKTLQDCYDEYYLNGTQNQKAAYRAAASKIDSLLFEK